MKIPASNSAHSNSKFRTKIHSIIFESDTPAGSFFDTALIVAILLSVAIVMLESVATIQKALGHELYLIEWGFTIFFTIEFILRLYSVHRPLKYLFSFYGMVDLISILPTYISFFYMDSHYLLSVRILRLLRIFRVLKLTRHVHESHVLYRALRSSLPKITVFLGSIMTIAVVIGTLMYLIEGKENGFTSIPRSVYWAIVTLTTVGYGDIAPQTPVGQLLSSLLMIIGYGIIAVPTGIVSAQLSRPKTEKFSGQACPDCGSDIHDDDAHFCKNCGARL